MLTATGLGCLAEVWKKKAAEEGRKRRMTNTLFYHHLKRTVSVRLPAAVQLNVLAERVEK